MTRFNARFIGSNDYRGFGLLLGCVLWALAVCARAESVPDLYAVTVPVAGQTQTDLQRAAAVGLRELVVRLSGRSSAADAPGLDAMYANAVRFLDQYSYERGGSGDAPWLAELRFGSASIDSELHKAGLPVWGGNRPALQTVLVIDANGTRAIVDDTSPYANTLRDQWRRRGLVLHLPRNANAINIDDVMQLDTAKVVASTPERADGFVLGRVTLAADGSCNSAWSLSLGTQEGMNAQSFSAESTGDALSTCVASALDRIVDDFSAQYAIAPNRSAEGVVLRVAGIANFDDYAALLNYLRRLAVIQNAQPVFVSGDAISLQLKVVGSAEQLARQLALESRLVPTHSATDTTLPVALSYRWAVRN